MFYKKGNNLFLSKGDTGVLSIKIGDSYPLTVDDRILFTIKDNYKPIIIRCITPVNNTAMVEFTNEMTQNLPAKDYKYDIRVIAHAELDEHGLPIDGDVVNTPFSTAIFKLLETVGDV